ncbi:MAG: homoserine kinase [Candidatus Neomarinimicrobiota bacterium]
MDLSVSVPATTANLGPGYDRLGLALDWRLKAVAHPAARWSVITQGEGARELQQDETNLVAQAGARYYERQGWQPQPLAIRVDNPIPLGRGLGSSAAAIVAGMALAQLAADGSLDHDTLFHEAAAMEGHSDNVAAAIYGGLQEVSNEAGNRTRPLPLTRTIQVVLVIPQATKSTAKLRAVLPAEVSAEDRAVTEAAYRAVVAGLATGDPAGLACSVEDRRHQPYRLKALPDSAGIFDIMRQQPDVAGAYLSGAGTTVAGWVLDGNNPTRALRKILEERGWPATVRLIRPDHQGVIGEI